MRFHFRPSNKGSCRASGVTVGLKLVCSAKVEVQIESAALGGIFYCP